MLFIAAFVFSKTHAQSPNASPEILKTFYLMEVSMLKSGRNTDNYCRQIFSSLQKAVDKEPAKAHPFYLAALQIDKNVKEYVSYIEGVKYNLEVNTGGRYAKGELREGQLIGRNNMEYHTKYMITSGNGAVLKTKINKLNIVISNIVKAKNIRPDEILSLKDIKAADNGSQTWESEMFVNSPLATVIALLTTMQKDAKNVGAEAMSEIVSKINAVDFHFDQLVAKVIPKSTMVLEGQKFEAEVILTGYNSKDNNVITVNGAPIKVENGVGKISQNASAGEHKYKGAILVKDPTTGENKSYDFEGE